MTPADLSTRILLNYFLAKILDSASQRGLIQANEPTITASSLTGKSY